MVYGKLNLRVMINSTINHKLEFSYNYIGLKFFWVETFFFVLVNPQ